ncbi:hypothetical protein [Croceitalea rosinachiae]|uniref:Uncharacterized protein n=1 Tax=Croceitalea rosinachiae TaxID=3075596 RepID=A0ABU3A7W1_9FLAO|nr:hypothetical protein [Croceitalea sp. F388]MDT0606267.1 hypothetical protein [Croceitalea sp. F388]
MLSSFETILGKLNAFTRKYYSKLLVKGVLLFLTLGLLFFLTITTVEYFLWLGTTARLALLLAFILIELFLFYRYILVPLFYLFRVKNGITNRQASLLIGKHFSNVDDKLVNLLDLAENNKESGLLLAAIEQRSEEMKPIPFAKAVDFKENLKYAKYVLVPILVVGALWVSGDISEFFGSYNRVINYDVAYEPPAPFSFVLLNEDLNLLEDQTLTLELNTEGKIKPEDISIVIDGGELLMQKSKGVFLYKFQPPLESTAFYFTANGFDSRTYSLNVGKVPAIQGFEMVLNYPRYLGKQNERLKGTGNTTVPEGTRVSWNIKGVHTDAIDFVANDTVIGFVKNTDEFVFSKSIYNNLNYELATSNDNVNNYETLGYQIDVVKDAYPTLKVEQTLDSLDPNLSYYSGIASDDIKLSKIRMVYYPKGNPDDFINLLLVVTNNTIEQFYYTFPSGVELETGKDYELYFEAFDNDGLRNGKSVKSQVFSISVLDDNQLKEKELDAQQSILQNLDKSLENFKEQKEALKEINDKQKENTNLEFNDQNQIKDFLQKQEQQESMMEKFSKQLKDNLNKRGKNDELNLLLQERLERQEKEASKNKKLLEELNKIADKIEKEELKKKLEELGKKQSNSERSLEQLLELTKRYYVTEKASQLSKELEKLSEEQKALSEEEESKNEQEKLNNEFNELSKELDELKKDNQDLKKPLDLDLSPQKQDGVKQDQKDALEQINKQKGLQEPSEDNERQEAGNRAKQKQKSAAQKMKEMSESLQQSASSSGGGSTITEDAEMLRQILDNLITFSFKQENLFDKIQESDGEIEQFSTTVREQKELRGLFEHVDDSLFALSLRRAELSEFVNEQITEVYYNIDKSLESIADNQIYQGASYQQYVLTASNSLADFLANLLDNMQQSMQPGQGQGQGDGFQLPDIIEGQESLQERMEQAGKKGEIGQKGQLGKEGKEGQGQKGKDGKEGKNGKSGEDGNSGSEGKNEDGQSGGTAGEKSGEGQNVNAKGGKGNGPSEVELKELYEIYKEQQVIRQKLEEQLKNILRKDKQDLAKKLVRQMENFENELLENGITQRTISKMNTIQQQLLKLENAALKQGKKKERESKTNNNQFQNPITTKPSLLENKSNTIEILNRQALPLRQNYQKKVKRYFENED